MKTLVFARGTRIRVTYFGTGETGSVDKKKWLPYSEKVEERIMTPRLLKNTGFKMGLDQLKNNLNKIGTSTNQEVVTNPSSSNQPEGRKLVKLNKDRLQKEEEENIRLMHEKIVEGDEGPLKYSCKDCSWKGKFLHKAKGHARDCGSRRKERKRNPKIKQYSCSGKDCDLAFPFLSQLQAHYRMCHFTPEQGYNCIHCKSLFGSWKNFKRHTENKHGVKPFILCHSCDYKTHRKDNMIRHMESQHSNLNMISSLLSDLIWHLDLEEDMGENLDEENHVENDGQDDQVEILVEESPVTREGSDSSDGQDEDISPYLRARNEHVAFVQAEFRKLYPTFGQEVLELKVKGRKRDGGEARKNDTFGSLPLMRS